VFGASHPAGTATAVILASILYQMGRMEEGDALYRDVLEVRLGGASARGISAGEQRRNYGRLLLEYGHFPEAEAQLLESLAILEAAYRGPSHPNVQESRRALMELYEAWGKPELVERYRVPPGRFYVY
jgi:hypothetical protein